MCHETLSKSIVTIAWWFLSLNLIILKFFFILKLLFLIDGKWRPRQLGTTEVGFWPAALWIYHIKVKHNDPAHPSPTLHLRPRVYSGRSQRIPEKCMWEMGFLRSALQMHQLRGNISTKINARAAKGQQIEILDLHPGVQQWSAILPVVWAG